MARLRADRQHVRAGDRLGSDCGADAAALAVRRGAGGPDGAPARDHPGAVARRARRARAPRAALPRTPRVLASRRHGGADGLRLPDDHAGALGDRREPRRQDGARLGDGAQHDGRERDACRRAGDGGGDDSVDRRRAGLSRARRAVPARARRAFPRRGCRRRRATITSRSRATCSRDSSISERIGSS